MSYLEQDDGDLIEDLIQRKEFYWTKRWNNHKNAFTDIIPRFMMEDAINKGHNLRLHSYQMFVQNFMNPNTPYKRLLLKWETGVGKTISSLACAMKFIEMYNLERDMGKTEIGSVFIIGFSERVFKSDLIKYPDFGFVSRDEKSQIENLRRLASLGNKSDIDKYADLITNIKKRLTNRKGNGYFKFIGYKAFVNRLFVLKTADNIVDLNELSEEEIINYLASGKLAYNEEMLAQFKNSLLICDEIHNTYNTLEKNNWGIAVQAVLDKEPTLRAIFLSATPLNNSPTEIIDLLNLLLTDKKLSKNEFFTGVGPTLKLKPNALEKIAEYSRGRVSFLRDVNPKYYPTVSNDGVSIKEIPYLKFIRCEMSPFHYDTYKKVFNGTLSQDSQYLVDFVIENPQYTYKGGDDKDFSNKDFSNEKSSDDEKSSNDEKSHIQNVGLYQTIEIKKGLTAASAKWKTDYKMDFVNGRIVGDAFKYDSLKKYSTKYVKMLDEIASCIKNSNGKIFIYHNIVHMSGVLFIEEVLSRNGYISEFGGSSDNTICMICGETRIKHKDYIGGDVNNLLSDANVPNVNSSTPMDKLSIVKNGSDNKYCWVRGDEFMMNFNIKKDKKNFYTKNKTYYYIPLSTVHNDLINGKSSIIKAFTLIFNKILSIKTLDVVAELSLNDTRYREWLIQIGFTLLHIGEKRAYMKFDTSNYDEKYFMNNYDNLCKDFNGEVSVSGGGDSKSNDNKLNSKSKHTFTPARFVMAHSEIDRNQMEHSLEKFNGIENSDGSRFMILVGSKIIKESYDLKAIQNVFIMGRPDNIPTLIQIRGRAVRKKSHIYLPENKRHVSVKIFTSCLPHGQLSYEEIKYKEKIHSFKMMQEIEKTLHENAIDGFINYELINRDRKNHTDPLSALPFDPIIKKKEYDLDDLNLSTFNIYHAKSEIEIIKVIIKRLFIEVSGVWKYDDLFKAVLSPPNMEIEVNTEMFSKNNFNIALNEIIYNNNQNYVEPFIKKPDEEIFSLNKVIDKITDGNEKNILLPSGQSAIIVPIVDVEQYFILFPLIDSVNGLIPNIDIESPYRIDKQIDNKYININNFIQTKKNDFDYEDKKKIFYRKYIDISIENMENVVCEYGATFHMKFLEECVEYVFRAWTDPTLVKSKYHEFYFKMLYYYDLLTLVMWAYACKPAIFKNYIDYALPVKAKEIKLKALSLYEKRKAELDDISPEDSSDLATSGIINLLKTSINRTSNVWIPQEFREQYNKTLSDSLKLFAGDKKKINKINKTTARLLPIGHFISKFPRLYIPEKGWTEDPTYSQNDIDYVENDIIIGYDEKSKTGVHVRFKLRNPIHSIKKYKDTRMIEKGTVCKSKNKSSLKAIAKKLDISLPDKINVDELCVLIRSKLIRNELKERIKKSKIKYFYFFYEEQIMH